MKHCSGVWCSPMQDYGSLFCGHALGYGDELMKLEARVKHNLSILSYWLFVLFVDRIMARACRRAGHSGKTETAKFVSISL